MPENPLTERVQQLIQDKVSTVLQLEILLHLYQVRPRFVPLTEMVRPLAIDPACARWNDSAISPCVRIVVW